jgi:3-phenylpropionate/cinnamic acid dioxygenase small subunit
MSELSTADRLAIHETLSRYCHCVDRKRWDEFKALFTPDCCLDFSQVLGRFEGHDGIQRFCDTMSSLGLFMRHLVTNVVIEGDGERARVAAYVLAITGAPGPAQQYGTGLYEDELVKRDGRWLLHRRHLMLDVPSA